MRATIRLGVILSMTVAAAPIPTAAPPAPPEPPAQNPSAAPAEAGTAVVSGVITDGTTNAPIAGAIVYLGPPMHGPPGAPVRQLTDAKGRFLFRDLPAFSGYFVSVSKPGYFDGRYGRGSSGSLGGRISLTDGQWFADANVTLWRPGVISGRVLDQRGDPVVDAYVRVLMRMLIGGRPQAVAGPIATTDDRGDYRIAGLEPGSYLVQVPSVQSTIPVSAATPLRERDTLSAAGRPSDGTRGAMRHGAHLLRLNQFLPALPPIDGRPSAYPPTFHPNARDVPGATWIDLGRGESRSDIDFRLDPVPTHRVSGRVEAPPEAVAGLTLRLLPAGTETLGDGAEAATTMVNDDGAFVFLNVPAGTYTLDASRNVMQYEARFAVGQQGTLPSPPRPPTGGTGISSGAVLSGPPGLTYRVSRAAGDVWWGRMLLDVRAADLSDVALRLQRAARMTGRWAWAEGEEPPSTPSSPMRLRLEPADGNPMLGVPQPPFVPPSQTVSTSGTFEVDGLLPGTYLLSALGPRLKSVTWNGRDHTYRPFDASTGQDITDVVVTLTTKTTLFAGVARDDRGAPADAGAVIVFPVERELWSNFGFSPALVKATATSNDGTFRFQSLPEGDYLVACVDIEHIDGWKDPGFLAKIAPTATRVSLRWGQDVTQDLRLVTIR